MDKVEYEKIWNIIIYPKITRMTLINDEILFIEGQIKEKIWLTYEKCKNTIHTYMHNPDGRIDRHKIASIMLYSIIINKPFELKLLPTKEAIKSESLLANEILAFEVAITIVWNFIMQDAINNNDNIKSEIFKSGFIFPECKHDDYVTHIYKMLYYAKYNNKYDVFAFSHILFFIEVYTETIMKMNLTNKI
jgi:hypothetical protein